MHGGVLCVALGARRTVQRHHAQDEAASGNLRTTTGAELRRGTGPPRAAPGLGHREWRRATPSIGQGARRAQKCAGGELR
jgi:hypothetical protein